MSAHQNLLQSKLAFCKGDLERFCKVDNSDYVLFFSVGPDPIAESSICKKDNDYVSRYEPSGCATCVKSG
jgi:hypothetical protein